MGLKEQFQRLGQKVGSGLQRFGQQASREFKTVGTFVRDKALPAIENVAGKVGAGITKYGVPIAAAVAPEFLPAVAAAGALASRVGAAASTGRSLIKAGENVVGAVKSGNVGRIATAGLAGRQELRRAGLKGV